MIVIALVIVAFYMGVVLGYEAGHYEGIRCSCVPKRPHFVNRLLNRCA